MATPDIAAQFAAMGAEIEAPVTEDVIEIWTCHARTVAAFFDIQTQWRVTELPGSLWLGLDYAGVDVALRRGGYDDVDFADLQLMERAAIDAFVGR